MHSNQEILSFTVENILWDSILLKINKPTIRLPELHTTDHAIRFWSKQCFLCKAQKGKEKKKVSPNN